MSDLRPLRRLHRVPGPALRPYVHILWGIDTTGDGDQAALREHVIPTGQMHLVFRLGGGPLRLFSGEHDRDGALAPAALIGGARETFYIREAAGTPSSVGVQLRPGAAEALFGIQADAFTAHHTALDAVWGHRADLMQEQLASAPSLEGRLDLLESMLTARLQRVRGLHPAVARALHDFRFTTDVGRVVRESGYSHRTLIAQFRRSVGLAPRGYTRVLRLQRALEAMRAGASLADLAVDAGYSDQAHLSREFREFSGITPSEYRRRGPAQPHHVPAGRGPR